MMVPFFSSIVTGSLESFIKNLWADTAAESHGHGQPGGGAASAHEHAHAQPQLSKAYTQGGGVEANGGKEAGRHLTSFM